ncbi:hypothetical protein [Nonomuraea sp. NPDC023979]|uniref:hypothetical protein n=1 Tax=Nonomuraea sp. NPDC023979 TaxID=3154796 RepID=UPI0033E6C390
MIEDDGPWLVDVPPGPVLPLWRLWLQNGVQLDGDHRWFVECRKPDCERAVPEGVRYCCTPCAVAAEGQYEISQHQANYNATWADRERALKDRFPT